MNFIFAILGWIVADKGETGSHTGIRQSDSDAQCDGSQTIVDNCGKLNANLMLFVAMVFCVMLAVSGRQLGAQSGKGARNV